MVIDFVFDFDIFLFHVLASLLKAIVGFADCLRFRLIEHHHLHITYICLLQCVVSSSNLNLSNALVRSTKQRNAGVLYSRDFSAICLMVKIASIVDLFLRKPCCPSFSGVWGFNLVAKMLVNSFIAELLSVMPLQLEESAFSF